MFFNKIFIHNHKFSCSRNKLRKHKLFVVIRIFPIIFNHSNVAYFI